MCSLADDDDGDVSGRRITAGLGVSRVLGAGVRVSGWDGENRGRATCSLRETTAVSQLSDPRGFWEVGSLHNEDSALSHLCQKGSYSSLSLKVLRVS